MPLYTVDQFKSALKGGAKSSKFYVEFPSPPGDGSIMFTMDDLILVHASSLPDIKMGSVEAYVQARKLVLPGEVEFGGNEWRCTIYQTPTHSTKEKFEKWIAKMDDYRNNSHTNKVSDWMVTCKVYQLDPETGTPTATYALYNAFPSALSSVDLDAKQANQIESFEVTFTYSYWERVSE